MCVALPTTWELLFLIESITSLNKYESLLYLTVNDEFFKIYWYIKNIHQYSFNETKQSGIKKSLK